MKLIKSLIVLSLLASVVACAQSKPAGSVASTPASLSDSNQVDSLKERADSLYEECRRSGDRVKACKQGRDAYFQYAEALPKESFDSRRTTFEASFRLCRIYKKLKMHDDIKNLPGTENPQTNTDRLNKFATDWPCEIATSGTSNGRIRPN